MDRLTIYRPFSFEIIPKYNFGVDFSDILTKIGISWKADGLSNVVDILAKLKGAKLYDFSVEAGTTIALPNSTANYPSKINYNGNISLTFYADTRAIASKLYYAWIDLMYCSVEGLDSLNGLMNPPIKWLANIPVYIYDRNGRLVQKRTYYDCYPTTISSNDYDKSSTEYQEDITIDLTVTGGLTVEFTGIGLGGVI